MGQACSKALESNIEDVDMLKTRAEVLLMLNLAPRCATTLPAAL